MKWHKMGNRLRAVITFRNMTELCQFLTRVARLADNLNHHPDVEIRNCNELVLSVFTHEKQVITEKDEQLTQRISELVSDVAFKSS